MLIKAQLKNIYIFKIISCIRLRNYVRSFEIIKTHPVNIISKN